MTGIVIFFIVICCQIIPISLSEQIRHVDYDILNSLFGIFGVDGNLSEQKSFPFPPKHMLELYEIYSGILSSEQNFRYRDANVVRSFSSKGVDDKYFFDLKNVHLNYEEIIGAEFRFFVDRTALDLQEDSSVFKVQLFQGQESESSKLVEERTVNGNKFGWIEFEVKIPVEEWYHNSELNKGFIVEFVDYKGNKLLTRIVQRQLKDKEPVLIVYSRNPLIGKSSTLQRRDGLTPEDANLIDKILDMSLDRKISRSIRATPEKKIDLCRRREFRIDFEKIGWFRWIIEPKWYNAYTCRGACVFGKNQNTTTHARLQSLVHHLGLTDDKNTPCCVPIELEPLSILFYDKDSNSVLAQFDDMVVTKCGCR